MSFTDKIKLYFREKSERLTHSDTGWGNRLYDFYLIFGQKEEGISPWVKTNWEEDFEPYFDLLIKQSVNGKETGIKTIKYKPEKRIAKKDNKDFIYLSEIKSGRLRWDSKSHEKWTIPNNTDHYFLNFELWTPIWTVCEKRNSPPDIFISISNERDFENTIEIQFGYFIVIAIAKNLRIESKPILKALSEKINSRITILKTRKWGKPEKAGNWTFVNWIQDTFSNGIYKGQNLHSINFNALEFEPIWEIIYREK